MFKFLRLFVESISFAISALRENILRTTLSLLGVTVGIFSIISVYTLVDGLEKSVRSSLSFVASDVMYIQKWPWTFGNDYPWWKYLNRPLPSLNEYHFLEKNLATASRIAMYTSRSGLTLKNGSNSSTVAIIGCTHSYSDMVKINIREGRFFTPSECEAGYAVAVIGNNIAENLFPYGSAIGQTFSFKGRKFKVVGVMPKEGVSLFSFFNSDDLVYATLPYFSTFFNIKKEGGDIGICLKGKADDPGMIKLETELRGLLRAKRGLKPLSDDDFAVNRPEMLSNFIGSIFAVLKVAGSVIGLFSILVGGFGIANIMFVSVRERTNIIGIQKSLGARNYFILFQFLFEAVFLCLLGGFGGLTFVFIATQIISYFELTPGLFLELSQANVITAIVISSLIGVIAGIVPAIMAARMDPVQAIRSK
jgi:putative ABC transport system permease protein